MVKIVIDCFGGDESPRVNIEGSIDALARFNDLELVLVGEDLLRDRDGKRGALAIRTLDRDVTTHHVQEHLRDRKT